MTFFLLTFALALARDKPTGPGPENAIVVAVHDGDTFTLASDDRVRLRWVNTPEIQPPEPYSIEARDATSAMLMNKSVHLLYGTTIRDGYGRLLAGADIDGKNLSIELLERGLAHLFIIPPDGTDFTDFIAAQARAKASRKGIWSTPSFQGVLHITSFHANADGDDRENVNGEYLRVCNVDPAAVDLSGYKISDISANSWELPALVIPPGNTVEIHSGKGTNQTDPSRQLEIFLQSADPIWNNTEDRATIYDRFGRSVDSRPHSAEKGSP